MPRVFLSCVTAEFGAYRIEIAKIFRRADWEVKSQEDFSQVPEDTIQKLDKYIKDCQAVIHIIGEGSGAPADSRAVSSFLNATPSFKKKMEAIGDFETLGISYTCWEAFLAAYHDLPIFVYQSSAALRDGHPTIAGGSDKEWPVFKPQSGDVERVSEHCQRLLQLPTRRYASAFKDRADLYGQFFSDFGNLGPKAILSFVRQERFGARQVDELKNLLRTLGDPLLKEGFVLAAFVHLAKEMPDVVGHDRSLDVEFIDALAEWDSHFVLLILVKACELRSRARGLNALSSALTSWLAAALTALNAFGGQNAGEAVSLTEQDIIAKFPLTPEKFAAFTFLKPSLEIAWRRDTMAPDGRVVAESYVRWGPCRRAASEPAGLGEVPHCLVESVRQSKQLQYAPIARLDFFVSEKELNRPWEYAAGSTPDDEYATLLPWPSVVRFLGPRISAGIQPPPDPVCRDRVACHFEYCPTFMADVRKSGAFFASHTGDEQSEKMLGGAAARAWLGFWMRTAKTTAIAEECLGDLNGLNFAAIPEFVFIKKLDSGKGSAWRDIAVLYDHPEWPVFKFKDQQTLADRLHVIHVQ